MRGGLPDDVEASLRELDTQALRTNIPAVAAAGTLLGGTDRVRETILSIILRATGWPEQYPQASFCFWLREQGWLDEVRCAIEDAGRNWHQELNNLYVSPHIRKALLKADPDLAAEEKGVSLVLRNQFPQLTTDINTAQFTEAAKKALQQNGEMPITLLVLDEVQQYINEDSDRSKYITEVAEALQTQFDSRVMLVGAGQSALAAGTDALMWLRDRFKISIQLADADVEAVTRKVLLRKKPSSEPDIESMLEANSGEIARHLQGTKAGERPEDRRIRIDDYPLLPTRRRFWDACFQAADAAGTHSQLRSQLRILHDALHDIAKRDLGTVMPASELFNALAPALVNTGVLLNEINTRIQKLDDGSKEGRLRRDLCGLVFLIGKLPQKESVVDMGIRATATILSDLMIDDIAKDSGPFRNNIAQLLAALAADGTLMKVDDEFRLQTTEGAEWDRAYREKQTSLRQNEVEISTRRDHLFNQHVQKVIGEIKPIHGEAKIRRTLSLYTGADPPQPGGDHVTIWLRDGWSSAEKDVSTEARRLGLDDPTIHIYLPKKSADELKKSIISTEASRQVLDHYGMPTTPEGREARESMESRQRTAEAGRDEIIRELIHAAKLLQGGGNEVFGEGLVEKIRAAVDASLARLYPRFNECDHRAWEVAVRRAKDGSDEPFKVVGWDQPTADHPVAKEVMATVGARTRGSDIQKALKAAPFGWPQDAIDAALIALHRSDHLRATRNGQPITVGRLDQAGLKAAEFSPEKVRLTTRDRIALRGLFAKVDIITRSGEEEAKAPDFLDALYQRATHIGGIAPMPRASDTTLIVELGRLTGNEQLSIILEKKAELEQKIDDWIKLAERAKGRCPVWERATAFRRYAEGLAALDEAGPEMDAINEQRSLLAENDPITPLEAKLASALREALTAMHKELSETIQQATEQLSADATWTKLDAPVQTEICNALGLEPPMPLVIAGNDQLKTSLDTRSLSAWQAEIDAIPSRTAKALEEAAKRVKEDDPGVETTTISVRRGTLTSAADVDAWLDEHDKKLKEAIAKGPVIVR